MAADMHALAASFGLCMGFLTPITALSPCPIKFPIVIKKKTPKKLSIKQKFAHPDLAKSIGCEYCPSLRLWSAHAPYYGFHSVRSVRFLPKKNLATLSSSSFTSSVLITMGGMPIFEAGNWLHQATAFYSVAIPTFFYINNFLGPRVMEPVFCRDYLIAKFEKIAAGPSTPTTSAANFTPSAGLAPKLPKTMFSRGPARSVKAVGSVMAFCLMALAKPVKKD